MSKTAKQDKVEQPKPAPDGLSEAARKAEEAFASDGKRTPAEWMARLQEYTLGRPMGKFGRAKFPTWRHNVADVLCGWTQHEHDANEPFRLTEDDYRGALKAAEEPPYQPPKGARSKFCKLVKE